MKEFKNKTILITGGTGSFGESLLNKYAIKIFLKKLESLVEMKKNRMI